MAASCAWSAPIGARRRGVARGMVVHENDCRCRQLQRALDDFAHVDGRVVDGAVALHFIGDEAVALVEKEDAELLAVLVALRGAQIIEHLLAR